MRQKEEHRDRLHRNYLRRKANGKQKQYEDRHNGVTLQSTPSARVRLT